LRRRSRLKTATASLQLQRRPEPRFRRDRSSRATKSDLRSERKMINELKGLGSGLVKFAKRVLKFKHDNAGHIELNGDKEVYCLTTAITGNVTTTSAPVGSIGVTSHATGRSSIFVSDGTKWQTHLAITPIEAA